MIRDRNTLSPESTTSDTLYTFCPTSNTDLIDKLTETIERLKL